MLTLKVVPASFSFSTVRRFASTAHGWSGRGRIGVWEARRTQSVWMAGVSGAAAGVKGSPGDGAARTLVHAGVPQGSPGAAEELLNSPVVSVDWLHEHLNQPNVKVLDASWYMPFENRKPFQEWQESRIPGALYFDLDAISDTSSKLPHMLPTETAFSAAISALGLSNEDSLVAYDGKGIFSAARVWWMFKIFGHKKVWVLDGGLPLWQAKGYPLESAVSADAIARVESASSAVKMIYEKEKVETGSFKAQLQEHRVWSLDKVRQNMEDKEYQLVDARSKGRFDGTAPEPRPGIQSGHIPGSACVPFTQVLSKDGTLLAPEELAKIYNGEGLSLDAPIAATCGTGVTACINALALYRLGKKEVPVYDGSWTEWVTTPNMPVASNMPISY